MTGPREVRIGVDAGGTFTDVVVVDEWNAVVALAKAPSTPADPSQGVLRGVEAAAAQLSLGLPELLARCAAFVHGSTVATNTVLEGKGARVGLVCTEGFRDTLAIRRGKRAHVWDLKEPRPPVLVPRHLRLGIRERTDRHGFAELAPELRDLERAAAIFEAAGVEAIAICLFNAFLNRANELRVGDFLAAQFPGMHLSISSQVVPLMGEYERVSTTVLDAYVAPRTAHYLEHLRDALVGLGLRPGRLLMAQSTGGVVDVEACIRRPVLTLLSGPSAGAAAARLYGRASGEANLVVFDMGGTSCDITMLREGVVARREQASIGGQDCLLPAIDVHTIGTGGGTIARTEAGVMLRVGPESAGADPGPACYGRGSDVPTVTDANLVLGRLDPQRFSGGRLPLYPERAKAAVDARVAQPLGVDPVRAAHGIIAVANQNMVEAIRLMTVQRGYDPREFTLAAAGGAAGLHAGAVARELGMPKVYIPRQAAHFCAVGLLQSDIEREYVLAMFDRVDRLTAERVDDAFARLGAQAREDLESSGLDPASAAYRYYAAMRYTGHQNSVLVPTTYPLEVEGDEALAAGFHRQHELLYGFSRSESQVEVIFLSLTARVPTPDVNLTPADRPTEPAPRVVEHRGLYFQELGCSVSAAVYLGEEVGPGTKIIGPALLESESTTILVLPDQTLEVDSVGNYILREGGSVAPH